MFPGRVNRLSKRKEHEAEEGVVAEKERGKNSVKSTKRTKEQSRLGATKHPLSLAVGRCTWQETLPWPDGNRRIFQHLTLKSE